MSQRWPQRIGRWSRDIAALEEGPAGRYLGGRYILPLIALVWIAMVFWDFGLPGLYVDEANDFAFAPGILSEQAAHLHHYRLPDNFLDDRDGVMRFPVVGGSLYQSTIAPYLGIPFFALLGYSWESIRLLTGLIGLVSILLATSLIARLFGWVPAALFGALVVTDPLSTFSLRAQGYQFWFVILFVVLAATILLRAAERTEVPLWMPVCAGVSTALTVHSYFEGLFFAVPVVAAAVVIFRRDRRALFSFLSAGIVAYSPVAYALLSIYARDPSLLAHFGLPDFAQRSDLQVFSFANLGRVAGLLASSFGDFRFTKSVVGSFGRTFEPLRLTLLLAGLGLAVHAALRKPGVTVSQRTFYRVAAGCVGMTLLGAFLLKSTNSHHLIPLTVLVYLILASTAAQTNLLRGLAIAVCGLLVVANSWGLALSHRALRTTGGLGYHNESFSMPAELFRTALREYHPVFASWGYHLQFLFQTKGTIPYTFLNKVDLEQIRKLMDQYGRVAVVVDVRDRNALSIPDQGDLRFSQRDGPALFDIVLLSEVGDGEASR